MNLALNNCHHCYIIVIIYNIKYQYKCEYVIYKLSCLLFLNCVCRTSNDIGHRYQKFVSVDPLNLILKTKFMVEIIQL